MGNECKCGKSISNRAKWCSDRCRKAASRTKKSDTDKVGQVKSDTEKNAMVRVIIDTVFGIKNYAQPDCECQHCQANRANGNRHTINHGKHKECYQLAANELNRVTLPGDVDYEGVAGRPDAACVPAQSHE